MNRSCIDTYDTRELLFIRYNLQESLHYTTRCFRIDNGSPGRALTFPEGVALPGYFLVEFEVRYPEDVLNLVVRGDWNVGAVRNKFHHLQKQVITSL